jgi:uncharacterized protein (DUF1330 family)
MESFHDSLCDRATEIHRPRCFKGRLLVSDERPQVLEGNWERDKVVLLSFPDEAAYREWAASPGYQEISKDRRAGADTFSLLVRGV